MSRQTFETPVERNAAKVDAFGIKGELGKLGTAGKERGGERRNDETTKRRNARNDETQETQKPRVGSVETFRARIND